MGFKLAVDIGGTFIDSIVLDESTGDLRHEKLPSLDSRLADNVLEAVDSAAIDAGEVDRFVHGTTLGLNAILERRGVETGLITNAGFEDVLEIGRETVPAGDRYNMGFRKSDEVIPRRRRVGVRGRIDSEGNVVQRLDGDEVRRAVDFLVEECSVDSIAVCFLYSYKDPSHERRVKAAIEAEYPEVTVSISSDVVAEHREYERTSTTAIEAYIKPIFASYLRDLEAGLAEHGFEGEFFITRSGGGAFSAETAKTAPIHTIFSGPAGGLIGCTETVRDLDTSGFISVDMGGTTTDVSVAAAGEPDVDYESTIDDKPVLMPRFDIRSIGAGGGSVAWCDDGLLKVGPRSAGADPGPVCYGRGGTEPTVTDACLLAGYLDPDGFLDGDVALDEEATRRRIRERIADPLELSIREATVGIIEVAAANVTTELKRITVEKGLDPRTFSMVAYGGAGPMCVPTVARRLGVREILVPPLPSVFSCWGMLLADVVYDASRTHVRSFDSVGRDEIRAAFDELERTLQDRLRSEGYPSDRQVFERTLEMRYFGQEHTVDVEVGRDDSKDALRTAFERNYRERYNHTKDAVVELVTVRARGIGLEDVRSSSPATASTGRTGGSPGAREAYCFARDDTVEFAVHDRRSLSPGEEVAGPAIVEEPTTTTVLHSDQRAVPNASGHLVIETANP